MSQYDATDFATNLFLTTYEGGAPRGITESLCGAMKAFKHTIKQLLHQYQYINIICTMLKENSQGRSP